MSAGATWLHNQRKTELTDIASKVGLKNYSDLLKADLETALDAHLRTNQSTLQKESSLTEYYKRIKTASPTKETALVPAKSTSKPASRRTTKSKDELEGTSGSGSSSAKTPKNKQLLPASIPLPPSPAVVASHIDRQTQRVRSRLNKVYKQSGLMETTDNIRDTVSSTQAIEFIAIMIELYGLRGQLMPMKSFTTISLPLTILETNEFTIKLPYVFTVITPEFWQILGLWALTTAILPLTFAYFFNLALKAKHGHIKSSKHVPSSAQYDHLTFNIAKAVIVHLVYSKHVQFYKYPHIISRKAVDKLVPGGYQTMFGSALIGILTSLYEAALRK